MHNHCRDNMVETLTLATRLIALSTNGGASCDRDSCQIYYGTVLDAAFKIRSATEKKLKELTNGAIFHEGREVTRSRPDAGKGV